MSRRTTVVVALMAALGLAACDRPEDQETGSVTADEVRRARDELDPAVRDALDAGNEAYRARNYPEALRHFQEAADADEDVAAAWFGIYMAQLALGNVEEAQAAMDRAQRLQPGASLIHPDSGSAAGSEGAAARTAPAAPAAPATTGDSTP